MTMQWKGLTEEEALSLPVDELALRILRAVRDNGEWNEYNWYNTMRGMARFGDPALHRCAEAWGWLRARGLIVRAPQNNPDAIFVTRRGEEVLEKGLGVVRAVERLDVDLHPRLEAKVRRQFLLGEYELAAFAALKEVEVAVRDKAGEPRWCPADGGKVDGRGLR